MPNSRTIRCCNSSSQVRRLFTVTVLGALLLITLRAGVADASVSFEVKGEWTCDNRGTVTPLAGARVELWRPGGISTLWIDEKLGATHTNANGAYSFSVRADDNFDLYSKVVMNDDQGVHLGNWYSFSDYDTETQTTGSHAGIVNLGNWQISHENGAGTPTCAAFQGAHNAYQNYKQLMGVAPPDSSYLINWDYPCCGVPFTLLDVTNWPGGYETGYGPKDPDGGYAVNFHEFAHSVRHSLDGGSLHFLYDAARFGYPKSHELCLLSNEGFAFNEGWAEFWAHTPATCGDGTNFNQEGNVAAALTGLEKCADRKTMVRVLALNPEAIHSYAEFKAKFFSIVGQRACVIKSIGGLQAVEKTIAAAPLLASTESQIVGETKLIASMSRRMAVVRTHAQDPGKCLKGRCVAALQTLIEPSALSTQIAQARLLRERLQSGLAAARSVINAPESAQLKLFETLDAERATFEAANQAIQIKGLQQGVAAIRAKPAFASARSTTAFRNMSQRLARLTAAHSRHVPTPTGVATFFSAPQVAGDVARRVGSR